MFGFSWYSTSSLFDILLSSLCGFPYGSLQSSFGSPFNVPKSASCFRHWPPYTTKPLLGNSKTGAWGQPFLSPVTPEGKLSRSQLAYLVAKSTQAKRLPEQGNYKGGRRASCFGGLSG